MQSFLPELKQYQIILASKSPRRQQLLKQMGIDFEVKVITIDESFSSHLKKEQIAIYLAEKKAAAFGGADLDDSTLLITADTIVWQKDEVLGKPENREEAYRILRELSGNSHEVITGVCLKTKSKNHSFYSLTKVWFRKLEDAEIYYYIDHYQPYDKAGAYGIQEWIGFIGIEKIEGSYYNVMGLPTSELYRALMEFV